MLNKVVGLAGTCLLLAAMAGVSGNATAQSAPHSLVASPDIYKVIAEGAQYRVIEVTWAPGQRDQPHSHPASAVYYPMDCSLGPIGQDGAVLRRLDIPSGSAIVQAPIASHTMQNLGTKACKLIMFEPK